MKNVYKIKTQGPSIIYDDGVETYIGEYKDRTGSPVTSYDIHITCDEPVEGKGYRIDLERMSVGFIDSDTYYKERPDQFKKIIFSTNRALGVQAIPKSILKQICKHPYILEYVATHKTTYKGTNGEFLYGITLPAINEPQESITPNVHEIKYEDVFNEGKKRDIATFIKNHQAAQRRKEKFLSITRYLRGGVLGMLLEYLYRVEYNAIGAVLCGLLALNIVMDLDSKNRIIGFFLDVYIYFLIGYIWLRQKIGRPVKQDLSKLRNPK
jgi:hypothetical protein